MAGGVRAARGPARSGRRIRRRPDAGLPGSGRIRWDRLGRIAFVVLVFLILVSYVGPLGNLVRSHGLVGQTAADLSEIQAENRLLERRTRHLTSDAVLEREARRQGMALPEEQPYVVEGVGR
ncbi:MAG: septum formation initiator family protein [Solirubrobacterales bacterium]|jgi:cell division protein FtsB